MKSDLFKRKFNLMPPPVQAWASRVRPQHPERAFKALTRARHGNDRSYEWMAEHAKNTDELRYLATLLNGRVLLGMPSGPRGDVVQTPKEIERVLADKAGKIGLGQIVEANPVAWQQVTRLGPTATPLQRQAAALVKVLEADPDKGANAHTFVDWLDESLPEDLPDFRKVVQRHHAENARRLKRGEAPLPRVSEFKVMGELAALLPADPRELEKRRRYEQEAVKAGGAKLLWQGASADEVLYSVPTMKAAQQLGRGTYWCTRHPDPQKNKFRHYSNDLFYLRRGGKVYQLHFDSHQFNDANDKAVTTKDVLVNAPGLGAALVPALTRSAERLVKGDYAAYDTSKRLPAYYAAENAELWAGAKAAFMPHISFLMQQFSDKSLADTLDILRGSYATKDADLQASAKATALHLISDREAEDEQRVKIAPLVQVCYATGDRDLQGVAKTKALVTVPGSMAFYAKLGQVAQMSSIVTSCYETGDSELRGTAKVALLHNLPGALERAKVSSVVRIGEMLQAIHKTGDADLCGQVDAAVLPHVPEAMQKAAKSGWQLDMASLLKGCYASQKVALRQAAKDSVLESFLLAVSTTGYPVHLASLITACGETGDAELITAARDAGTQYRKDDTGLAKALAALPPVVGRGLGMAQRPLQP